MTDKWRNEKEHMDEKKREGNKSKLNDGLCAIADLIERAQDDTCRAQRRLGMGREGAAKCEALNAKQCLILAIAKFEEIGT
jgi:hypothetical protein